MKIALIHHPLGHRCFSENLNIIDEEFCLAPPLVLAYVASILEKNGHDVILIDANALGLDKEKTLTIVNNFSPDLIGFRADTYWFHRVVEWATFLKKNISAKIFIGGINVELYPAESLAYECFDYGIIGEANRSLPELLSAIQEGGAVASIPGVIWKEQGRVNLPLSKHALADFDTYPFPARHLLPNDRYYSFTSQLKNFTIMVTSTGCPYQCTFCAIAKIPFRQRSAKNVVDEIEECYAKYNVREIDFFDATFFVDKKRALEICDEIIRRRIKIEWSCRSRTDVVDAEILRKAAMAGCRKIYYGIESVSDVVLCNINKKITRQQIVDAIALTRKCKIMALGFFMVGNQGDTKDDVLASIRFAKELKLDFIQVCRTIAKPKTDLDQFLIKVHNRDYWREYIAGKREEARLPTPWTSFSEKELEYYIRKFYADFYFRPAYVLQRLRHLRSVTELVRYMKVGMRWFFCSRRDAL